MKKEKKKKRSRFFLGAAHVTPDKPNGEDMSKQLWLSKSVSAKSTPDPLEPCPGCSGHSRSLRHLRVST